MSKKTGFILLILGVCFMVEAQAATITGKVAFEGTAPFAVCARPVSSSVTWVQ